MTGWAGGPCRFIVLFSPMLYIWLSMIKIKENEVQWATTCVKTSTSLTINWEDGSCFTGASPWGRADWVPVAGISALQNSRITQANQRGQGKQDCPENPSIFPATAPSPLNSSPARARPIQSSTKPRTHSPGFQLPQASLFPKPFNSPLTWFDEFLAGHQVHWEIKSQTASTS